jgi:RNA polymerase sigma-70 factor, ECF subfamily
LAPTRRCSVDLVRDPDAELVAACRHPEHDGFEAAFEALYAKYRDRVYSIALRITGSSADAMDVAQECFGLVFRKLDGFRSDALFSTWLFRIVVNCSIDHRRRERSHAPKLESVDAEEAEIEDLADGPLQSAQSMELGGQVQAAIRMLSPKLSSILALRYLEDMSYEQLAATLGLSLGTVKSRLARAHLALEKVVREQFPHLDLSVAADLKGGVA